jgi:GxxExxY protein
LGETAEAYGRLAPEGRARPVGPRFSEEVERIGTQVVDAAYTVHRALGPGLLESVYEACLARELVTRGLAVRTQVPMPVTYDGAEFEAGFRLDILVDERVVVEVKAVEMVAAVHVAQLRTYLKLAGLRLGFLVNFNVALIKHGIRRVTVSGGDAG